MNIIDAVLILIILMAAFRGWQKGFMWGMLDLISWLGTLLAGIWLYPYMLRLLETYLHLSGIWSFTLSFFLTLVLVRISINFLLTPAYRSALTAPSRKKADAVLGIIPGMVNGIIYAALVSAVLLAVPFSQAITQKSQKSQTAIVLTAQLRKLESKLSPGFKDAIRRSTASLTIDRSAGRSIPLHFTLKDAKPRADLEAEMLKMLNRERRKKGLQPLKHDPELVPVARAHSADMFARGYFSHITPEGKTPSDRIREAEVEFITAGENLALAQTLAIAHNGLMNSPGHRANILRPAFGRVGIGILDGGIYGIMVTQNFRN